ncbi:hypothetical protein ALC53_14204 [Atta colombica]|uniref:Uncharacterized protein n=1 Tax=Atta colombica TaxID=520822 RepID=A0A195ATF9_9HYME|nr:hypothetical protein ALC53_14204 [Atta colombica]
MYPYRSLTARRKSCVPPAIERLTCSIWCRLAPAFFAGAFCDFDISIVPEDPFRYHTPVVPQLTTNTTNLEYYFSRNFDIYWIYSQGTRHIVYEHFVQKYILLSCEDPVVLRVANYINPTGLARRDYQRSELPNPVLTVNTSDIAVHNAPIKFTTYPSLRHAPSRPPSVVREYDGRAH